MSFTHMVNYIPFITNLLIIIMGSFGQIEIQGHRGARGLMPENTLPAFQKAIELGINTLELDVVISNDNKVIVSHEPWLNPNICLDPNGDPIKNKKINLYQMNYEEIAKCDCGILPYSNFPEQQKVAASKPLLKDVIQLITRPEYAKRNIKLNIEIKSDPAGDGLFHPIPSEFIDLVYQEIAEVSVSRLNIQSFDPRILNEWRKRFPQYSLAYLVDDRRNWSAQMKDLHFQPEIYSPNYRRITKAMVMEIHEVGMKVIVWTVNSEPEIRRIAAMEVDGIITDYPDRALNTLGYTQN